LFRLRTVLEWKESLEIQARVTRLEWEQRERDLAARGAAVRSSEDALPSGTFSVEDLAMWSRYADGLRQRGARLRARLEQLTKEVDVRRRAHDDLRREVAGLRKLKERHETRRRHSLEKQRQEQTDDWSTRRLLPEPGSRFPGTDVSEEDN